jgi:serine protease
VLPLPLVLALVVATSPAGPPAPGAPAARSFVVLDGGAPRVVLRGAVPGTDDAPVEVRYVDPVSGRGADARVGRGVIARVAAGDEERAVAVLQRLGLVVRRPLFPRAGLWLVASPDVAEDGVALAARLARQGRVAGPGAAGASDDDAVVPSLREAFPDLHLPHRAASADAPSIPPDDPRYPGQFFLADLDIEDAWARSVGSPDVSVVVVDNGCDLQHPDLAAKLDPGHDVVDDDDDPSFGAGAGNEHGTACAGLIAALTDNGRDVAGACPLCRASCTRLLSGGPVPLNADVRAFGLAFEDDADVVSNSWGFVDAVPVPQVLADAIVTVQQEGRGGRGAVVVFASGNDSREIGDDELLAVPGVLGVGAVNNLGELTQFSNRGRSVDVVAPTGTITTDISGAGGADPGDVTVRFGGTSSACPLVAGVAGLILAAAPDLTADEVNAVVERTAAQSIFATPDDTGHDLDYGFGLLRPAAALDDVLGTAPDGDGGSGDDDDAPAAGCAQATPPTGAVLLALLAGLGGRGVVGAGRRRRVVPGPRRPGREEVTPGSRTR